MPKEKKKPDIKEKKFILLKEDCTYRITIECEIGCYIDMVNGIEN